MKKYSMFSAVGRLALVGAAMEAHGIDPDAEDVSAAIAAKLGANPDAVAKAANWDKLSAQAASEGFKLEDILGSESGVTTRVENVARDVLRKHLAETAPKITDPKPDENPGDPSALDGKGKAAHYRKLTISGNAEAASAFYAAHSAEFLSHLSLTEG